MTQEPMNREEHIDHAIRVFRLWFESRKEAMPDWLSSQAEVTIAYAREHQRDFFLVDFIAATYQDAVGRREQRRAA